MKTLQKDNDTLYIFIDEGGSFYTPNDVPAFCLGGCIIHESQLSEINSNLEEIKQEILGDRNLPLSAEVVSQLSDKDKRRLFDFLKDYQFGRLAITYNRNYKLQTWITIKESTYDFCREAFRVLVLPKLLECYPEVYSSDKIVLIFRDDDVDQKVAQNKLIGSYFFNDKKVQLNGYFLSKEDSVPCLEVANIVSDLAYQNAKRQYNKEESTDFYEFDSIYYPEDLKLQYHFELLRVETE